MRNLLRNFRWGLDGSLQDMLVENGRVTWRRPAGASDKGHDLGGKWLLPKFVDSHCHILPTGLDLGKLHLGRCSSRDDVLQAVRERLPSVEAGRWLHAVHYDQTRFADGGHLTRWDLDKVSTNVPILLRHVNGHAGVANSAALALAGVSGETSDPAGGEYRRDSSGRPDGVLLERTLEIVGSAAPQPTEDEMVTAIRAAAQHMSKLGIGCASDMMTGSFDLLTELRAYRRASESSSDVRFRLYLQWSPLLGRRAADPEQVREEIEAMDPDRCRVAGVKIFADGAIASATAAIYGRFLTEGPQGPTPGTSGQLMYPPERLTEMVRVAHDAGHPLAIHAIGDYAVDLVMDAYEAVGDARRHRIEHVMILSDQQIDRLKRLGCRCTMQPEFLFRLGHAYHKQLGPERAARLKRARSVLDAGIPLSFSSDRPIVAGDPWDGIRTAVARPAGFDPEENVTLWEALLAYTQWGADTNGDGDLMGSLEPGQLADYQVLDGWPEHAPQPTMLNGVMSRTT
ncbi:MAG TPA: amidohydrolase [Fimbriimonadaceae bacterium]|nr:amidohydrolase [Fimbriimonadaceae bacterium]